MVHLRLDAALGRRVHGGEQPNLFHYRESRGLEIDIILEQGNMLDAVEVKSGSTISKDFFKNLERLGNRLKNKSYQIRNHLVYGGKRSQKRTAANVWSWRDAGNI